MSLTEYTIDSVTIKDKMRGAEAIQFLGNQKYGWMLSAESVMNRIQKGYGEFFVTDMMMGKKIPIKIVKSKNGVNILSAFDNNRPWDTLLGLPDCQQLNLID